MNSLHTIIMSNIKNNWRAKIPVLVYLSLTLMFILALFILLHFIFIRPQLEMANPDISQLMHYFGIIIFTTSLICIGLNSNVYFFEPIASEFGWSYAQISLASSLRGLEMGLFAPIIGALVDRLGSRRIMFLGAILIGLGLLALSRVNSLGMFYAAFVLVASGLSTCSNTAMVAAVAKWFRRKVGLAIGMMICGYGFSGFMVPVVVRLIAKDPYKKKRRHANI